MQGTLKKNVYDCFIFFNELDLLELRLNELNRVVDYFVLVESRYSHTNQPKPLFFNENKKRFSQFLPKIRHIIIDSFESVPPIESYSFYKNDKGYRAMVKKNPSLWARELFQRDQIIKGLHDAKPTDVVLIGDVDEIPRAEAVAKSLDTEEILVLKQTMYVGYINLKVIKLWSGTKVLPCSLLSSPQEIRLVRKAKAIYHGGWHFSSIGSLEQIRYKLASYTHQELHTKQNSSTAAIMKYLDYGLNISETGFPVRSAKIDSSFPDYILKNRQQFAKYEKPTVKRRKFLTSDIDFLRLEIEKLRNKANVLQMENELLKMTIEEFELSTKLP